MSDYFETFLQNLLTGGLEHFRRYYGIYRGEVTTNSDPANRGRIQARVLEVGHDIAPNIWIDPAFDGAGSGFGSFWPPEVGSVVRVSFSRGDASLPSCYWGGWFGTGQVPKELVPSGSPTRRGFVTRMGHQLTFDDQDGKETVTLVWHQAAASDPAKSNRTKAANRAEGKTSSLIFTDDGSIRVVNAAGSSLILDVTEEEVVIRDEDNQQTITMNSNGVTIDAKGSMTVKASSFDALTKVVALVDGADTPAVRGLDLVKLFATHTHGTAVGPSSPPLNAPQTTSILSKNVTLK